MSRQTLLPQPLPDPPKMSSRLPNSSKSESSSLLRPATSLKPLPFPLNYAPAGARPYLELVRLDKVCTFSSQHQFHLFLHLIANRYLASVLAIR
jgi:hypothetical protein